jgi:ABC-type phosphate transport system substrate-binding protein
MPMKKTLLAFLCSSVVINVCAGELVLIGNRKNQLKTLESNQIQDIYMGRKRAFPDGKMALPIDQATTRSDFYEKLTFRQIEQINAYWARIMFSGQASPPMILPDDASIIKTVMENEGAIGYVSKASVTKQVQVLLILK